MDNKDISIRFFTALETLKRDKVIHGISNYTERYGINRRNLYKLKQDPTRDLLKVWWLSVLVTDYNISPEWLLTGKGSLYKTKTEPDTNRI